MQLSIENCPITSRLQINPPLSAIAGSKQCLGKRQRGHNLLELLIVIVIIAILATMSLPIYDHYIHRAKVAEAINLLGALKTPIGEIGYGKFINLESCDNCGGVMMCSPGTCVGCLSMIPVCADSGKPQGQYTSVIRGIGNGCLSATMRENYIFMGDVALCYNSTTNVWNCDTPETTMMPKYLPSNCK